MNENDNVSWANEMPTPEELEQEARYYEWLESQYESKAAAVAEDDEDVDDDDCGYCGPTCGRFGDW